LSRTETNVRARGEKTAQVLESSLTSLEKKIDDLLAGFEESERRMMEQAGRALNGKSPAADQETASDEKGGSGGQANP
jgi:hypothetical protein